ncbi:translocation/assembly module TamB domain-containing protein [Silvibacterium acidisoli]|uniref:translocation/assembly module TamB domain-containing protein n=1 Tax=Acidobacteriaceae bacterium ZG23-2 TaxID=2883246 RepID=UPI00406CA4DE
MATDETTEPNPEKESTHHRRLAIRVAAWLAGALVVLLLISALAVEVLLHNTRFHNYVLATVEKKASETLGTEVHLQNFALNLSSLSLDLYGLRVNGAAPYPNPPLLEVDHAEAGVRVISFLQRKWYVDGIRIDHPIVRIYVDAKGVSNIPTIKSSGKSSSNTSVFDLGIRHAVLDKGEVYYNDRKSVLSADLREVDFRASFDPSLTKYTGSLSYSDGHLLSGTFRPIPHNLSAQFDATPTAFHLTNAKLTSGASQVTLTATVQNYSNPLVQAHYDASVDGAEVREILKIATIPTGVVHATGSAQYAAVPNQPALNAVTLQGDVNSSQLDVRTPSLRTQIRNIAGHYSLAQGNVTLQDFKAGLLGGVLTAQGEMDDLAGNTHSKVSAGLRGISVADLKRTFAPAALPKSVVVSGGVNAQATATWGKTFDDLVAKADASMHSNVAGRNPDGSAAQSIPVESALHGVYTGKTQEVVLANSYLRTPATNLSLNGKVSNHSSLNVKLQANDLHEFETISMLFRTPSPGHPVTALGLAGTASFQGTVRGTTAAPRLQGVLTASNAHISGSTVKVLHTNVDVSPSYASLQNADLELLPRGKLAFNASTELHKWSFLKSSEVQVDLTASQLDIAQLQSLAGQQYPVTGVLNANVKLHGTQLNPVGNGDVSVTNLVAYQEPVKSVHLTFAGTGEEVQSNLAVDLPAGSVTGSATVRPQQRTYTAQLHSTGIHLDQLQALKSRNLSANGVVALQATGQGSFDNPQLDATLTIPQLVIQNQTVQSLNLKMNLADHVANANLSTSAIGTGIQGQARVELTGDYMTDAKIDTQSIPLQPLVATYAPDQAGDVTGQTEVHATLHGPLKNKSLLEAHVTIPVLKVGYTDNIQLAATAPIKVDYKNNVIQVQRSAIQGTDTNLQFGGTIPTSGNGPMSLMLLGTVDLKLAQLFEPDIRSGGQLKFNINSNGPVNASDIGGEIDIVNASYSSADLPVGLQRGNGVLTLTKDRLNVSRFEGTVGGGKVTAQGGVVYRPNVQFDLGVSAQGVRALYPQGMRESVDASLRLTGSTDNALLGGNVSLTEISFTPAFDLTSFINQFSGGISAPPSPGFSQNLQLNIGVHSTNDIELVSRTLSIGGSANLQVRGTASQPVILGRVNLTNGDLILNGDRFVLDGGTIQFVNPSETEPVVNVSLNTTIQQYNIFLRFQGPVAQLHTEYSSDPALPSADIINLLAFGNTTEANSANPSTPANQAAESLVASQVSSQVTSRISKVAGISQLSINPVLQGGSNQGPPGANITIQQRVTGNLFVTFTSNVASTQNQTIQGQYQISPRVAVSATRDQNGGFAFDTLIKKNW